MVQLTVISDVMTDESEENCVDPFDLVVVDPPHRRVCRRRPQVEVPSQPEAVVNQLVPSLLDLAEGLDVDFCAGILSHSLTMCPSCP